MKLVASTDLAPFHHARQFLGTVPLCVLLPGDATPVQKPSSQIFILILAKMTLSSRNAYFLCVYLYVFSVRCISGASCEKSPPCHVVVGYRRKE